MDESQLRIEEPNLTKQVVEGVVLLPRGYSLGGERLDQHCEGLQRPEVSLLCTTASASRSPFPVPGCIGDGIDGAGSGLLTHESSVCRCKVFILVISRPTSRWWCDLQNGSIRLFIYDMCIEDLFIKRLGSFDSGRHFDFCYLCMDTQTA